MLNKQSLLLIIIFFGVTVLERLYGEFLIDTSIAFSATPYDQKSSSIAYDGINYMVVWADFRNGTDANIYCARVNSAGQIIGPKGILVSGALNNQSTPAIAFDGTNYLVVWSDGRNGTYSDIYCARVQSDGTVLDPNGMPVSTATSNQTNPAITFDGTNYLVVWEDYRNGNYPDLYGTRITTTGVILDPNGIPLITYTNSQSYPALAFDGTRYLMVWQDDRNLNWDIYGTRIDPSGNILNPNGFPISEETSYQWYPAIAFDGMNYLVVWSDRRNSIYDQIYGARVSQSGVILDPSGIPIATSATYGQYFPKLAFDGTNYFVVWDDYRSSSHNIMGARVTPGGVVLDPNGRYISNAARDQLYPAIIFGGMNYLVTCDDYRSNTDFDIYAARVDPTGNCLDYNGILISSSSNYQYTPAIAFDGTNYLVVWEDTRGISYSNIKGARVSLSGLVLDPSLISISTATNDQIAPAIAFDDTNYLVVWGDRRNGAWDIYGTRMSQAGTVLNPAGIAISTAANYQEYPAVAFDDTNYLVVWQDKRGGTYYDIYGTRLNRSGTVLNPTGIGISTASNDQLSPDLDFDGTNYLVVWEDYRNNSTVPDIYCTRVNRSGTVLNPTGIAVSTAAGHQYTPKVAFGGTNYLVVWSDNRNNGNWDIYGARVTPTGTILDPNGIAICTNSATQLYPDVGFDGTNYIVVWSDTRNGNFDIYGAQVTTTGTVLNTFVVSSRSGDKIDPALAFGTGNQICTVYSGFTDSINSIPVNTMRIWCHQYSLIGVEENPTFNPDLKTILFQNLPNPFKKNTLIKLQVSGANSKISLTIYDSQGRLIKTLFSGPVMPGIHYLKWDGTDENGKDAGSGVYLCKMQYGPYCEIKKMTLLK